MREAGKKSAEQLKNAVHAVALTGDHWMSVSYKNHLAVTAHYIDNDWTLQSFALTVQHTEEDTMQKHVPSFSSKLQRNGLLQRR